MGERGMDNWMWKEINRKPTARERKAEQRKKQIEKRRHRRASKDLRRYNRINFAEITNTILIVSALIIIFYIIMRLII